LVKDLDELTSIELLDHVGWRLWLAAAGWKIEFEAGMRGLGYEWFGEARSNLLAYIGPRGIRQKVLVERAAMSKQAVQQLLDELVEEGVVERVQDRHDRRGKFIRYTRAGLKVLRDANVVKTSIEDRYRTKLGDAAFRQLMDSLRRLGDSGAG
jgi:DNA-binding MarR family transcriptional regulator